MTQRLWAVIPAAGTGSRFAASQPKQYMALAGRTVLEHSAQPLLNNPQISAVLVALSPDDTHFSQLPIASNPRLKKVTGGAERADSVARALAALAEEAGDSDWVLVHDAARPCLSAADLDHLLSETFAKGRGGLLAAPLVDTIKRADSRGDVADTLDRNHLWRALTPQVFRYGELREALRSCRQQSLQVTDEASAIEHCGGSVRLVVGSAANIKVTYPEDLALAEFYLRAQNSEGG